MPSCGSVRRGHVEPHAARRLAETAQSTQGAASAALALPHGEKVVSWPRPDCRIDRGRQLHVQRRDSRARRSGKQTPQPSSSSAARSRPEVHLCSTQLRYPEMVL